MKSPYTGGKVKKVTTPETITFKGEPFTLEVESYECMDTGNRFATGEMNDAVAARVQDMWRERYNVPTVAQLKAIREQLGGISYAKMSKLLNIGINQYRYYENGEIPKGPILLLLRLLINQDVLPYILSLQADVLPKKLKAALLQYFDGKKQLVEVETTPKVNPDEKQSVPFDLHSKSFTDFSYATAESSQTTAVSLEYSSPV